MGGLGIRDPTKIADDEYQFSRTVTTELTNNILKQENHTSSETRNIPKIKPAINL